jgi:transcriptional regulator with XRE-family HTH domain
MSLANLVAKNLLAARSRRNLTQQALAAKVRISVSYVSMLERGERTPPLDTLEALAKAMAVSPLDLLGESAPKRGRSNKAR